MATPEYSPVKQINFSSNFLTSAAAGAIEKHINETGIIRVSAVDSDSVKKIGRAIARVIESNPAVACRLYFDDKENRLTFEVRDQAFGKNGSNQEI